MDDKSAEAEYAAMWRESTIARNMHRHLEEIPAIIDRYYANPCPATFVPLQEMHEQQRKMVVQAEQQQERLRQMASDLEAIIKKVRQKTDEAEARGDREKAETGTREQAGFEDLLLSVQ